MIQPAQEPFHPGVRPDIIGEGDGKTGDKAETVNPRGGDRAEAAPRHRVKNQRRRADKRKHDADPMDDAIGDNLVKIILAPEPPHLAHGPFPSACFHQSMEPILDRNKTAAG
ncbi:hypothetical protein D3C72_1732120 [compost metagenome]